ncbi:signal peptidase II [Treponema primitia]|uniref:signal peptidase II n=1 Tax=Treponema primitia TaxID=88058 RepID=UPI0002554CF4|nr:signal peptidase II [Treponema primitia]
MTAKNKHKLMPVLLTGFIILADQLVKGFIVKNWPLRNANGGEFIKDVFNNDLIWIIHVRNKAIAFSLGNNLPDVLRPALFIILPLLVLAFLGWYYFKTNELSNVQRWAFAGIIGGGIGNIIDRIFRPDGVVDFISVKFYGFLGLDRWPTFNIADSSVVICGILLFLTIIIFPPRPEAAVQ